jgi:hypothetical protein
LGAGAWLGAGVSGVLYYGLGFFFYVAGCGSARNTMSRLDHPLILDPQKSCVSDLGIS